MNRNYINLSVIVSLVVISLILSSCSSSGKATNFGIKNCIDSDGGINEFIAGTVMFNLREFKDECLGNALKEYYCISDKEVSDVDIRCDYGCDRNKCNEKPASVCGNNMLEQGEECDGNSLNLTECTDFEDFTGGTLLCNEDCTFNTDSCTNNVLTCGNGKLEPGEECDDGNFLIEECSYGLDSCIVCNDVCALVEGEVSFCGDYAVDIENNEECDNSNLDNKQCSNLIGYESGQLSCNQDCTFNTEECVKSEEIPDLPSYCGDNIFQNPNDQGVSEQCDNSDLNEKTCIDFGFISGELQCNSNCEFDTTACYILEEKKCNNGIIDPGEQCETNSFGTLSCQSFGYESGTLLCNPDCKLDLSFCE